MFNWYKKYREEKRDYKQYKNRIAALPEDYKTAMKAIETYLWNFAKGAGMFEILKNVLEMFENAAADNLELKAVVGDDLKERYFRMRMANRANPLLNLCRNSSLYADQISILVSHDILTLLSDIIPAVKCIIAQIQFRPGGNF